MYCKDLFTYVFVLVFLQLYLKLSEVIDLQ